VQFYLCGQGGYFWGFLLFYNSVFLTGVGNASTFQMISSIMHKEINRIMPNINAADRLKTAERESAAIIAFTSAIAAYGAFFIPQSYGTAIRMTSSPHAALWCFLGFYVICLLLTFLVYSRPGGMLYDIEHRCSAAQNQTV